MRRQSWLLVAVTMLAIAGGAGAAETRIGFATPLTGPYAATGIVHRIAVELAVEDLNDTGGVLGQPVGILAKDDRCGVEEAVAAAQALVDAGTQFVVGHLCSDSSLMAAAIYEAAGVPMMTTTASHPRLTEEGRGNVFRLIGRDDRQGSIAGDFLADRWLDDRIAILHDGTTYGHGLADQTRQQLWQRGVKETLFLDYPLGSMDYSALVDQLQQADIEVAYVAGYGPDAARIIRTARERGDDLQLVGGHGLGMAEFWEIAGPAGEGTIFTARRDTGLLPETTPVLSVLRAHGLGQHPSSVATYAAVQIWAQAVERAGTLDAAAVIKVLHRGRFETALGWVAFDEKGDLEGGDWQWQVWTEGDYELFKAPSVLTR